MNDSLGRYSCHPKIKIFVSRRLDVPSMIVKNPLYVPTICGAVYADNENSSLIKDSTGQNISAKRNSFCEFTVQYWAWKNAEADYYGLCHYRRYLTFSHKHFKENSQRQVMEGLLDSYTIRKYDLLNEKRMRDVIEAYDAIVNVSADVRYIPTPHGYQDSVYDHWAAHGGMFFDKQVLPMLLETIREMKPQYYDSALAYMHDRWHRGYNCYIMKKALFNKMCEFQFPVMFTMEKKVSQAGLDKEFPRTIGYLGEMMYGIFIYHLQKQGKYKIKEQQLVYFEQTVPPDSLWQRVMDHLLFWAKFRFENVGYKILPKNSRRRNFVKKIYFRLVKR